MMNSLIYFLLMVSNVYAFIYSPLFSSQLSTPLLKSSRGLKAHNIEMSGEYLENINNDSVFLNNNKPTPEDAKLKKLQSISRNINEYMKTTSKKTDAKIEQGFKSTYMPIPKAPFDTIFININQIKKIYISASVDRMIFELSSGRRYVYYINNKDDYNKMDQLIKLIPSQHKICIINDVHNTMDDPFGHLYCETK